MKTLMLLVCMWLSVWAASAQNVIIDGTPPNFYINHTVQPKENFYSLGRMYNQAPKLIATFNNLTMEKGLSIGQHVKVPLTAQNFEAMEKAAGGEILVPLKHVVAKGENIFKIGTAHNVTAQSIREWNLLSSDVVAAGTALIVGHLKVKTESALANGKGAAAAPASTPAPSVETPAKPALANQPVVKETTKTTPVATPEPKPAPAEEAVAVKPVTPPPAPKTEVVPVKEIQRPVETTTTPAKPEPKKIDMSTTPASKAEGAFAPLFASESNGKTLGSKTGDAATFKTNSGWQDGKYYVLMNDVNPGTILRVSVSGGNKVIYAKVLGSIPEMKENNGLMLRISNSAASQLGIVDSRFPIEVSFYQ